MVPYYPRWASIDIPGELLVCTSKRMSETHFDRCRLASLWAHLEIPEGSHGGCQNRSIGSLWAHLEISRNTEERPTCRDYIEISTHRAICYHLEDSRSHETEAEAKRGQDLGARLVSLGAHPPAEPNQDSFSQEISTDLLDPE